LEKSKCSVIVSIDTSEFNKINQPDNEITHPPYDIVRFSIRQSADSLQLLIPAKKILSNFNNCKSSSDFPGIFNDLSNLSFFWVNFNIGVILRYNSQKDGTWGASDIWHNTLEPWFPWIK
jgi:hypothetical protein